jgi:hypothetical protein
LRVRVGETAGDQWGFNKSGEAMQTRSGTLRYSSFLSPSYCGVTFDGVDNHFKVVATKIGDDPLGAVEPGRRLSAGLPPHPFGLT